MKSISKINLTLLALSMSLMGFAQALSEREGLDIYQRGLYLEAIEYWKKAAAAGDAGSAYRLSEEYFDAKIVKRDLKLALKYLRQASEGNDARALTDLASLYDYGTGVRENRAKAGELYLRAARMGMPAAMFNVASMLETGEGLAQDKVEAYKYYVLSRDQGFAPFAVKAIEEISANMTVEQIAEGEKRADNFIPDTF
ncbi:MAG: sel1 repeat family protein [Rhodobiaceae bacterium]|mgnify:FL=1|jgi:TPR repeat protein|nr:sel1 repeat family protein [Rhodobiaceae bacterium]MBT5517901.1 sel1 repeat family protein [Rhodobiaceae bacterium]